MILAKYVKPFKIYRKLNYLSFYFDLSPCGRDHRILFFKSATLDYHIVRFFSKLDHDLSQMKYTNIMRCNFFAKYAKLFRIYHKMKYLIVDFDLWP